MRAAEAGFAHLREEARSLEGEASQADKEAYWARALFGIGRPDLALTAIERAHEMAGSAGAMAPKFIAHLARAEGGLLFENWEQAREGAQAALNVSLSSLPAWENVCRYLLARAMCGLGDLDEGRSQAEAALAATPSGANGTRWRLRIEELQLEVADMWDRRRAEDITDLFLQSRWLGAAVDLMTARAARENDAEVAAEAASLAVQIGNPVQAAKAVRAGKLWRDPLAAPVLSSARALADHCPPDWYPSFLAEPEAAAALAIATEVSDEEMALLREKISQALESAGLSGDTVLSPAQRRTAGLVHRRPARRRNPLAWLAAAVAVAAIATAAALAVVNLTAPDPIAAPTTTAPPQTTTTLAPKEARVIPAPESGISGTYAFRGDVGRSGVASGGFREVEGYYWRLRPGGSFVPTTSPVSYGRWVYVVTDENKLYGYELSGGRLNLVIQADNPITATPTIGQPAGSETVDPLIVFPTNDGVVHAFSAVRTGAGVWAYQTDSTVRAPALVIEQSVFVATTDGRLHAIDLQSGELLWRYPAAESEVDRPRRSSLVQHGSSFLRRSRLCDKPRREPPCSRCRHRGAFVPPSDRSERDRQHLSSRSLKVWYSWDSKTRLESTPSLQEPAGTRPEDIRPSIPARWRCVSGCWRRPTRCMSSKIGYCWRCCWTAALWLDAAGSTPSPWDGGPFGAADIITTPPVLADGVLYVGSQDGMVHAIDAESGVVLWQFNAESAVRGELVVVPGAVVVTTAAGEIIAIAGQ